MLRLNKIVWYGVRAFYAISFVFLISLTGAMLLSLVPVNTSYAQNEPETIEIFVISNGIHTDLVLPVKTHVTDWRTEIPLHHFKEADSTYKSIAFGWGDRKFYMETPEWSDLTLEVVLSAALWPTPSAMHVAYFPSKPAPSQHQKPVLLSVTQYKALVNYIRNSFQQRNGDVILIPGAGYTSNDNFYEGREKFFFPKSCNNWVNSGLKAAGVKTAFWAPLPFSIMRHLQ